jgi:choline-glycine betaine transporter
MPRKFWSDITFGIYLVFGYATSQFLCFVIVSVEPADVFRKESFVILLYISLLVCVCVCVCVWRNCHCGDVS